MNAKKFNVKALLLGFLALTVVSFTLFCTWAALSPNETLEFTRAVPSRSAPEVLKVPLSNLSEWPRWFYAATEVKVLPSENGKNLLEKGAKLQFVIEPKKNPEKRFTLLAEVLDYREGSLIELKVLEESTGKLRKLFDQLTWKVEVLPGADGGSLIRGTELATTVSWRARLFGKLARRILMHQIFYPDLIKLAEITQLEASPQAQSLLAPPETLKQSAVEAVRSVISNRSR